ncbi:hypothetical protein [Sinosporangium siamense]|uniref:Uncharacterized protein n=1 Tax=Sinosporangium siamense TaxID=1367973 RepID=A0A919RPR9_9ACTN|nr:hypothetical protein [Sinosporangium siamense]GII97032.1 hypothetical protein Ssi02_72630 [Sinosporangium siamense]
MDGPLADAARQWDDSAPWIVVAATFPGDAEDLLDALHASTIERRVRREAGSWPAPILAGEEPPRRRPESLTITSRSADPPKDVVVELRAGGSIVAAVQVGSERSRPADGAQVCAIGEGAVAWITAVLLRLTAACAQEVGMDTMTVRADIVDLRPVSADVPLELWSHSQGILQPAGTWRGDDIGEVRLDVRTAECLTPELFLRARAILLGLLDRFGVKDSRHIDEHGVVRRNAFVGHADRIRTWLEALGASSAP